MGNLQVSVIIPTYNRPVALAELLGALVEQTFQHFEVIIVNDAGQEVDSVAALYPELDIRVIDLQENHYHVYARNQGIKAAKGSYIMFMDDDDLPLPSHMERMVNGLKSAELVYSDVEIVDYEETETKRIPLNHYLFAYEYDLQAMRQFSTYVPSGSMYKKEIHDQVGRLDEEMRNYWDWDFFLRVAEGFRVERIPVASVLYGFSLEGNNQSKNLDNMRFYLNRLSKKHDLGYLPTKNFYLLLEEPSVKQRESESERIWDGEMPPSRYVR
ncbi:glycosyltransferase family 2 protein [Gracilibacillus sp. YIM 98692]|uniref:glycosyltransferase family 2 protein n=1 Tax=Gracilibacillus sp. YIM 98692 TaxID=2663532 RepID=UPI0013D617D5|nr:glycosyltransferase family 2 protein [Gracilibacillus sp. YIM 98692]